MQFNLAAWIMNPFVLMMITVFLGMFFGKIKFGKFTFGVSGCLFVGLVIGWWVYGLASTFPKTESGYKEALELIKNGVIDKGFFTLFLILFIAAVGLLAAKDIGIIIKRDNYKKVRLEIYYLGVFNYFYWCRSNLRNGLNFTGDKFL
jgi:putative transport protein